MIARDLATLLLALAVVRVGAIFDVWTGALASAAALCAFYALTAPAWTMAPRVEVEPHPPDRHHEP